MHLSSIDSKTSKKEDTGEKRGDEKRELIEAYEKYLKGVKAAKE